MGRHGQEVSRELSLHSSEEPFITYPHRSRAKTQPSLAADHAGTAGKIWGGESRKRLRA